MNTLKPIIGQHTEHKEWLNKLSFYKDDLVILQNRIDDIVKHNTSVELMAKVEQFQNQLTIQHEVIDLIKHDIGLHESDIEKSILNNPVGSDHRKMDDHTAVRDKIIRFEELFAELRKNLLSFLSKAM